MQAKQVELGEPLNPQIVEWVYPENHPGVQPMVEPGLVVMDGVYCAIKARKFRPDGSVAEDEDAVYSADAIRMTYAINQAAYIPPADERVTGVEDEIPVVDDKKGSMPADLYNEDLPDHLAELLETHPELLRGTFETDAGPEKTIELTYEALAAELRLMVESLPPHLHIDPASAQMHEMPTEKDVSPNPYVQSTYHAWGERLLKFIGHGIHEHHDVHVKLAPIVAKYARVMAPLLNVGLQAAPHGYGFIKPRLSEILEINDLRQYDHEDRQVNSVRYPARLIGSHGGIGLPVILTDLDDVNRQTDIMLKSGSINSPARGLAGSYADVRLRTDLPNAKLVDHLGRLELCVKDTGAQRIETLKAWGTLSSAVIQQLVRVAAGGEEAIDLMHQEFPELVGKNTEDNVFAYHQLHYAGVTSTELAYDGPDATILNGMGTYTSVHSQIYHLIRFAESSGIELPEDVKGTIHASILSAAITEQVMTGFKDKDGAPSLRGYYLTGAGTPAQWMIKRADVLRDENGLSDKDNLRNGTEDRTESFERYITSRALAA